MNNYTCVTPTVDGAWYTLVLAELETEGKLTYKETENLIVATETKQQRIRRLSRMETQ
jgi:hypothetical protein